MGRPDIEAWFYGLDLKQLQRLFSWRDCQDANEFIDACDEAWGEMTEEEREEMYNHYLDWF